MPDFILKRDQARQELFDTIALFCQEVDAMPLQEREESLQVFKFLKFGSWGKSISFTDLTKGRQSGNQSVE